VDFIPAVADWVFSVYGVGARFFFAPEPGVVGFGAFGKIVLDTNVFVSDVFFTGPPYEILQAWRNGRAHLLISPAIMDYIIS